MIATNHARTGADAARAGGNNLPPAGWLRHVLGALMRALAAPCF